MGELSPEELKAARDYADTLLGAVPAREGDAAALWFAELRAELQSQAGAAVPHWPSFRKRAAAKPLATAAGTAEAFIASITAGKLERAALRRLAAELVVRAARRRRAPEALWARVAAALAETEALVEQAFPGYLRSGLLARVVRAAAAV